MSAVRQTECRIAIVGAGPQGLTVATHLVAAGVAPDDIVVVDPLGAWLSAWSRRCARLRIAHLRSPSVHHPHPDPYALPAFAEASGRRAELLWRYGLPTTSLFGDFCEHVVAQHRLGSAVVAAAVESVEPDGRLWTDSGVCIAAKHVVWATDPAVEPRLPAHPRVRRWDSAEGELGPQPGSLVAVLGGGLSAAHLVERALAVGCEVDWISRAPLRVREFDTDPGWLGPKYMSSFHGEPDQSVRLARVIEARAGGTVPPWMMARLAPALASGQLRCRVGSVEEGDADALRVDGTALSADEIWPAWGSTPSVSASPALDHLCRTMGVGRCGDRPLLDRWLRLGPTCVHVVGRLAQLRLGPTAGNLSGARHAAIRVVGAVLGLEAAYRIDHVGAIGDIR